MMSFDPDRGFMLNAGVKHTRYGFRAYPYFSRNQTSVGWAFGRSKLFVDHRQYYRGLLGEGVDLGLRGRFSGLEVLHFYGLGNETTQDESNSFYAVDQRQLTLTGTVSVGDGEGTEWGIGPVFKRTVSDTTVSGNFVADEKPYGSGTLMQVGVQTSLDLDRRDHLTWPTSGYHASAGAAYYPGFMDLDSYVVEARGEVATFLSPSGGNPTLATRVGGKHLWGTFPYYEAAFLGGTRNVRGLREDRYAGRSSLYGSAELRVSLGRFFVIFPANFGLFGFGDLGRVFADDLPSDKWHNAYGGGIWIAPLTRATTFQISLARSEQRTAFYFGLGFAY
jgi:outer membrane protein assembly factor BamA